MHVPDPRSIPNTEWVEDFLLEFGRFPRGKNDDQVDAATQALQRLIAAIQSGSFSIGLINGHNHNEIFRGSNLPNHLKRGSAFAGSNLPDPHASILSASNLIDPQASIFKGSNLPDPLGSPHGGSFWPRNAPPGKPHHIF